MRSWSEDGF